MPFIPPSEDELATVKRLKTSLEENQEVVMSPRITETCILRFLRGSKGEADKALSRLVRHSKWRQENHADDIETMIHRFQKQIDRRLSLLHHVDKEGRPCLYCFVHRHDASDRDLEDMILFIVYSLETLVRNSKPDEETFNVFFDLSRFSMRNMDFEVVKNLINILQTNYPDTLERFNIIDSPMIFSACWAVIRPWIDPVTAHKVQFIRRSQIAEYCNPADIPSFDD